MKIDLTEPVYADLRLLSHAWSVDENGAIERLIAGLRSEPVIAPPSSHATQIQPDWVGVYADYKGTRVDGEYHTQTESLRITAGLRNRQTFASPSAAAAAVVSELNPKVTPNRNGWGFWNVAATGETLQQLRRR
jgi:hypothetical protein